MAVLDRDTYEMWGSYCSFMKNAGIIAWDLRDEPVVDDPAVGALYNALAAVEEDSKFMQRKLHHAGILRDDVIRRFNVQWLCEEQEHATVLRALALTRGYPPESFDHRLRARDRRAAFAVLGLRSLRIHQKAIVGLYFAVGAINEYIALSTYVYLASRSHTENERTILRNLARQEGRHMRFYRSGLQSLMQSSGTFTRWLVRSILIALWRPPGIDLLSRDRWLAAFQPVLASNAARGRLVEADRVINSVVGLDRVDLMARFLNDHPADRFQLPELILDHERVMR